MHTKNPDLFRFHLLVSFSVARYLLCNTPGRQDGTEKAEVHKDLCEKFIAFDKLINPDDAWDYKRRSKTKYFGTPQRDDFLRGEALYDFVHDHTQKLTGHLDSIGMPKDTSKFPDYDAMEDAFTREFYRLANEAVTMWDNARDSIHEPEDMPGPEA
ncbi:hypothetical protein ACGYLO_18265 [Sulfitobacter sp. 1A13353]|uniref:hypothetical protein n=1 Tax=Sulfitobacter sp. 1A13353 TaxID=3368568 RepID=UPI003746A4C5